MGRTRSRWAWVVILIAEVAILVWGLLVLVEPEQLALGFEGYTGQPWSELVAEQPSTAAFMLNVFRLLGAYNVAFALVAAAVCVTAFRRGEAWAWWTLLIGNTLGYAAPMIYDQVVGEIGSFEILEYVFLGGVYTALAVTAPTRRKGRREETYHPGGSAERPDSLLS